jgi:AraC-like DNA-binding protein
MSHASPPRAIAAANLSSLIKLTSRFGVESEELFDSLELRPEDVADPEMMVSVPTLVTLAERARLLTGEPGIGVYLGLETYAVEYGYVGFAWMTAPTLRAAVDLTVKFAPTRASAFAFSSAVEGPRAAMIVEELADFGSARDVVLLALFVGLRHAAVAAIGSERDTTFVELEIEEPWYWDGFRHLRPPVHFGRPRNALVFDAAALDLPLATANTASHRLAVEQCRRLLEPIVSRSTFCDRVERLILRTEGGLRSLDDVAAALSMSSRTLRRHLTAEKTSFAALRDRAYRERALFLLLTRDLSPAEVAEHLGYSNVASFTRAFQRWTGHGPSSYCRAGRRGT